MGYFEKEHVYLVTIKVFCQLRADFQPPFLLFHKIGVTSELFGRCVSSLRRTKAQKHFEVFYQKAARLEKKFQHAVILWDTLKKEHLYHKIMCQMRASSLSADHTFKVSTNIGFWCEGKWIQLYDSLFIVMNEIGIVLAWKLCKGTAFDKVEDLFTSLKDTKGSVVNNFYLDNCCQRRHKLNSVFDGVSTLYKV